MMEMDNKLPPISSLPLPSEHDEWGPELEALGSPITERGMDERWKTIDSAPKDGTFILGYWGERIYPHGFLTRYEVTYWISHDEVYGDWYSPVTGDDILAPTHWQPLPPPPKEST